MLSDSLLFNKLFYCSRGITTPPVRVRGLSVDLMMILYERGALSCPEIAELMNKTPRFIRVYLHRLLKKGLLRRSEFLWELSEKGLLFIERKVFINNIYRKIYIEDNKRITKGLQKDNKNITNVIYHQFIMKSMIKRALERYGLSENERGVVLLLLENYFNSGCRRKFMYFKDSEDASSFFKLNPYALRDALISLHNKGIIYFKPVMGLLKIGLMKGFIGEIVGEVERVEA